MPTYHPSLESVQLTNTWLAIGSFDGVHAGHRELIGRMVDGAHGAGCRAAVMTLYPHPSRVLRNLTTPIYLSTFEERCDLLGQLGIDDLIQLPFNRRIASESAATFMNRTVFHLGLKDLFVGENFALGHDRKGNPVELARLGKVLGYQVTVVPPLHLDGIVISSSQVRAWLSEGDLEMATKALCRPYRVCGTIVHGDGRGGQIGIPTANLEVWQEQVLPAGGVYACWAVIGDQRFAAVTNIGLRPTFQSDHPHVTVEAHLLEYNADLYIQRVCLEFIQRLRGEVRFDGVQSLVKQIHADIAAARRLLV